MLGRVYDSAGPSRFPLDRPYGLRRRGLATIPQAHDDSTNENGAEAPSFAVKHFSQGFRMRSSSALPIAWVRLTTFSFLRIFCTWFFTVSGLIFRIAPISKLLLPR